MVKPVQTPHSKIATAAMLLFARFLHRQYEETLWLHCPLELITVVTTNIERSLFDPRCGRNL
jgi:hypothetical protein